MGQNSRSVNDACVYRTDSMFVIVLTRWLVTLVWNGYLIRNSMSSIMVSVTVIFRVILFRPLNANLSMFAMLNSIMHVIVRIVSMWLTESLACRLLLFTATISYKL